MLFTQQWEKRSSIRNRPHRSLNSEASLFFFPPAEQPLALHPKIIALGDDGLRYLLTQSAYLFMKTIFINETRVINAIVNKIIVNESAIHLPVDTRQNLLTVLIDESYHAYVANDFIMQVEAATGITPINFAAESNLSHALASMKNLIAPAHWDAFEIIVACIAENSITKELISITRDAQVDPLFYAINDDHIADEGRHCRIFAHALRDVWRTISLDTKEAIGPLLPVFIRSYLDRSIAKQNDHTLLSSLSLTSDDITTILYDTYPDLPDHTMFAFNPIVKNIVALLKQSDVLSHARTARAFNLESPSPAPLLAEAKSGEPDPHHVTVASLFQEQVAEHPEEIAIIHNDRHISYRELDTMSSIICAHLLAKGLKPGAIIAVVHAHGYEYVALILGIMKAGMVFMPLAHDAPTLRLRMILRDAEPRLVVVDDEKQFETLCADWRYTTSTRLLTHADHDVASTQALCMPDHLAYIIYTSGSSGEQKGVMVQHSSLANFAQSIAHTFAIEKRDRILQFAPYCFDPSLAEIFGTLISGATLCIRPSHILDSSEHFFAVCRQLEITLLNLPTSLWYQLIRDVDTLAQHLPKSLKTVVIGGEAVKSHQLRLWYEHAPHTIKLLNTYGPTETTIAATACNLNDFPILRERESLIGTSCARSSLFVLDEARNPVPIGVVGELYIGGPGVSLGYFKRPDLTAERFVHCDTLLAEGPLYRTGDRVKWVMPSQHARPQLAFIGRVDKQIKLRGFRIELEEVEKVITGLDGVLHSRVLFQQEHELEHLIAFIMPHPSAFLSAEQLRSALRSLLPHYMQPSQFVFTERWPMTSNGKIDDAMLLASASSTTATLQSNTRHHETRLQAIWQSLLNTSLIDHESHFFHLGGHSLLALRLLAIINRDFRTELTVRHIFENPRFKQMVALLDLHANDQPYAQLSLSEPKARLSPSQEALWLNDQLHNGASINYNIAYAIHLRDLPNLNYAALLSSLNHLLARHPILRTRFLVRDGAPLPITEDHALQLIAEPITPNEFNSIALAEARNPFDLASSPPLRIRLFHLGHHYHVVLINHHHIIHDGHSINIFLQELQTCYDAYLDGTTPGLPELTMHYANYACEQHENSLASHTYWTKQLMAYQPLHLPFRTRNAHLNPECGSRHQFSVDANTVDALRRLCVEEDCTFFVGILSVFYLLFYHDSGMDDVTIATMMSTREHEHDYHIFGPFINAVLLRQRIAPEELFTSFIHQVKATFVDGTIHRHYPLERITNSLTMNRLPGDNRLFDVMMVFHAREHYPTTMSSPNLRGDIEFIDNNTAKFGLMCDVFERDSSIDLAFTFCPNTFAQADVEAITQRFLRLLAICVTKSHCSLQAILELLRDDA